MDSNHQSSESHLEGLIDGLVKELNESPNDERIWVACGTLYLIKDDLEQALDCFYMAHNLDPSDPYIFFRLGVIYFRLKDFETSRTWLKRYLEIARPLEIDWMAFYFLSLSEKSLGNLESSAETLRKGLKLFPKKILLLLTYAELEFERNQFERAAEIFETLLRIESKQEYWYFLFRCYMELGFEDLATHSFRQFLHIDPNFQLDENWVSLFGLTVHAESLKELQKNISNIEAKVLAKRDISKLEILKSLYQGDTTKNYSEKISAILKHLGEDYTTP